MTTSELAAVLRSALQPGRRLGLAALVAAGLTLAWMLYTLVPLLLAPLSSPGAAPKAVPEATLAQKQAGFTKLLADSTARITDRAPFGQIRVATPAPAARPTTPTRYGGPNIVAMVDNAVWFADGRRLKVGESSGESLSVLEVNAPWSAKLRWSGGEFTVSLFDRSPINLSQPMSVWLGPPPPPSITAPTPARPAASAAPGSTPPPVNLPPGGVVLPPGTTTIVVPSGGALPPSGGVERAAPPPPPPPPPSEPAHSDTPQPAGPAPQPAEPAPDNPVPPTPPPPPPPPEKP